MPLGEPRNVSSPSLGGQFKKKFNVNHDVRVVFVTRDSAGNSVYRFEWSVPIRGRSLGPIHTSRTFAVSKSGSVWSFFSPDYTAEGREPIPDPDDVFSPHTGFISRGNRPQDVISNFSSSLRDAKDRAFDIVERWISKERITLEDGQALINSIFAMSDVRNIESVMARGPGGRTRPGGRRERGGGGVDDGFFDPFADIGGGGGRGGGGGGGGGRVGPVYRAPDRRNTEDLVKGMLVSLIGSGFSVYQEEFTDLFMKEDRRNFDSERTAIDPSASVLEAIRGTKEYKTIHKLRPESTDERTWISDRIRAAQFGGLTGSRQEGFAIEQAATGGDIEDVQRAASVAQLQSSGQAEGGLERKLRSVAESLFSQVRV